MLFDGDSPIDSDTVQSTVSLTVTLAWAAAALVTAYIAATLLSVLIRRFARRRRLMHDLATRLRHPLRMLLMIVAVWVAFRLSAHEDEAWFDVLQHGLLIATIVSSAWLVGAMAFVVEDRTIARTSVASNDRHARRVKTQISILRRVTVAIIVILAIAAVLLTFPAMRAAGASILASAGVLSVVAGIAAQSSLANTFAGIQIAFTDAIRVDDVVVLDGQFGRIEEITLTYVVVHIWDDRRLILPSTQFTTTPFENWTRRAADLLGTVEVDVDFNVPLPAMRAELERLLEDSPLWDQRLGILQITDATGGMVKAWALVSAADAGTLWDLRCHVREGLVQWLQREAPYAMPRRRFEDAVPLPDGGAPELPDAADAEASAELEPGEQEPMPMPVSVEPPSSAASAASPAPGGGRRGDETVVVPGRTSTGRPRRSSVRDRQRAGVPASGPDEDATVLIGEVPAPQRGVDETTVMPPSQPVGLYSGSEEAEARRENFEGPGQDAIDEREAVAERRMTGEVAIDDEVDDQDESRTASRWRGRPAPDSEDGGPTDGPGDGGGRGDGGDGQ
ncbi:mechanosensitive ion channel family protein [Isoptericola rhizosphaerae]|uniref:mechanosensitive ion channel family protein n=1 Tax=Isoptericola rhizosphaerae TaxID=3377837 RepID=UPI00383B2C72